VEPFPGAGFTVPTYRNSDRSRHYGLEAGLGYILPFPLFTDSDGGDELSLQAAWTYSRNVYIGDVSFGDNDIPGVPDHVIQAQVEWKHPVGIAIAPNLEWAPGSYYVNSRNDAENDGWFVLGLRGTWEIASTGLSAFVEGRNLTDATYSGSVNVDDAAGRFYQPADGRAVVAGLRLGLGEK
jgi:iron complex outermembrane receptor protein